MIFADKNISVVFIPIYLWSNLCEQSVFCHVKDTGRAWNQWLAAAFDLVSVHLIQGVNHSWKPWIVLEFSLMPLELLHLLDTVRKSLFRNRVSPFLVVKQASTVLLVNLCINIISCGFILIVRTLQIVILNLSIEVMWVNYNWDLG